MQYTVFINLEPYLEQWLKHECDGEYPIRFKKSSAENDIILQYLKPQPKREGYVPQLRAEEGQIAIVLPCFKSKDIRTYNYLHPKGAIKLRECIRNRFCVALWKDLNTVGHVMMRNDISISNWMKAHGIVDDDKNWNTIAKILQRKRAVYCPNKRLSDRKTSKHTKKTPKIHPTSEAICPPV